MGEGHRCSGLNNKIKILLITSVLILTLNVSIVKGEAGVSVTRDGLYQEIPKEVWTPINWTGNDLWDFGQMHNPAFNNSQIYINETGIYQISAHIVYNVSNKGIRGLSIKINGSASCICTVVPYLKNNETYITWVAIRKLYEGSYIQFMTYQDTTGNLGLYGTTNKTRAQIYRLDSDLETATVLDTDAITEGVGESLETGFPFVITIYFIAAGIMIMAAAISYFTKEKRS